MTEDGKEMNEFNKDEGGILNNWSVAKTIFKQAGVGARGGELKAQLGRWKSEISLSSSKENVEEAVELWGEMGLKIKVQDSPSY